MAKPLTMTMPSAASEATPNTYTQEATYAGWRSGSSLFGGSADMPRRRSLAVHIRSSPGAAAYGSADSSGGVASCAASPWWRRPGKGSSSAAPKMATMTAISTRFATEIVKMFQFR
jgi:hypothetical protein